MAELQKATAMRQASTKWPMPCGVAVVHDWLVVYGGAERVLRELIALFPDCDL